MRVAIMFSGGKDSCYSIWLALHQAWEVVRLVSVNPHLPDSLMFHYPNVRWTALQAKTMGLKISAVEGESEELLQLEHILTEMKAEYQLDGLVTGAISSDFQKSRIDAVCEAVGLRSFSPIWHKKPDTLIEDLIQTGFRIVITGVAASGLDKSWIGRELTPEEWARLREISRKYGLNLSGEGGEYETFVIDAPHFTKKIEITESSVVWEGQSGHLEIGKAALRMR